MDQVLVNTKSIEVVYENVQHPVSLVDVTVLFSQEYNRHPCTAMDPTFENTWNKKIENNPRLYNGSKFRFASVNFDTDKVCICLGLTNYKETICSNHCPNMNELYEYGERHYNNRQACLSDSLGVASIVTTKDKQIVLIRRSDWVAEQQGLVDTPGGHPEPDELLKKLLSTNIFSVDESLTRHELFYSIVREVRDELNVYEESLSFPKLLGIVRNKDLGGKPCLLFMLHCDLNKHKILELYAKGGAETDESTELIFCSIKEFLLSEERVMDIVSKMAPCGQAAMCLYYDHIKSSKVLLDVE